MGSRAGAIAVAALVAAVVFAALWASGPPPEPIRPGQVAPGFTLPRLDGTPVSLAEQQGKVVLLNFWATWCKPCEDEMPAMQRLYDALAGTDFEMLAVSTDEDLATVEAFRDRLGLRFPILHDPEKKVSVAYQTYRYPESYLIGRDGTILARYIGPRDWDAAVYRERIRGLATGATGGAAAAPE
jgi:peroxiredoxin